MTIKRRMVKISTKFITVVTLVGKKSRGLGRDTLRVSTVGQASGSYTQTNFII